MRLAIKYRNYTDKFIEFPHGATDAGVAAGVRWCEAIVWHRCLLHFRLLHKQLKRMSRHCRLRLANWLSQIIIIAISQIITRTQSAEFVSCDWSRIWFHHLAAVHRLINNKNSLQIKMNLLENGERAKRLNKPHSDRYRGCAGVRCGMHCN